MFFDIYFGKLKQSKFYFSNKVIGNSKNNYSNKNAVVIGANNDEKKELIMQNIEIAYYNRKNILVIENNIDLYKQYESFFEDDEDDENKYSVYKINASELEIKEIESINNDMKLNDAPSCILIFDDSDLTNILANTINIENFLHKYIETKTNKKEKIHFMSRNVLKINDLIIIDTDKSIKDNYILSNIETLNKKHIEILLFKDSLMLYLKELRNNSLFITNHIKNYIFYKYNFNEIDYLLKHYLGYKDITKTKIKILNKDEIMYINTANYKITSLILKK